MIKKVIYMNSITGINVIFYLLQSYVFVLFIYLSFPKICDFSLKNVFLTQNHSRVANMMEGRYLYQMCN